MAQAQLSKPLLDQESMTIFSIITKEQPMATITKSITVKLLMCLHFSSPSWALH